MAGSVGSVVRGITGGDVSAEVAALKAAQREQRVANIVASRAGEVAHLDDLAAAYAAPGRVGGTVEGLTRPDMFALQAYHGADKVGDLSSDVVRDTVATAHAAATKDVAIVVKGTPAPGIAHLMEELRLRGASPRIIDTSSLTKEWSADGASGRLIDSAGHDVVVPDVAIPRGSRNVPLLRAMEANGTFMVNGGDAAVASSSKGRMAKHIGDLQPPQVNGITDTDALVAATDGFGYPAIVKEEVGGGGKQVYQAIDQADARTMGDELFGRAKAPVVTVQEKLDTGARGQRVNTVNDVYDTPQFVTRFHRIGPEGEFKDNGPNGNVTRHIPIGGDDETVGSEVDMALAAHAAMPGSMRNAGSDIWVDRPTGRTFVGEINPTSGFPELDVDGVPRPEHVISKIADLATWGPGAEQNRALRARLAAE